jgi:radical SAM-linked protein
VRIGYQKTGDYRFFSQLAMSQQIERLLRRSGLRFAYSGGFHPRMRMASLPPLPVHAEGLEEVVELAVAGDHDEAALLERLQAAGQGFPFRWVGYWEQGAALGRDLGFLEYEFHAPVPNDIRAEIGRLLLEGEGLEE